MTVIKSEMKMEKANTTKRKPAKKKIGTILSSETVQLLKERAVRENRTMSEVIERALGELSSLQKTTGASRVQAVRRFCSQPFKVSAKEIEELLHEDYYGV